MQPFLRGVVSMTPGMDDNCSRLLDKPLDLGVPVALANFALACCFLSVL
jgi:hypothetical protein